MASLSAAHLLAGLAAIGIELGSAAERSTEADSVGMRRMPLLRFPSRLRPHGVAMRKTREGTKQALLVAMLSRADGATIDEIVAVTRWQLNTVRRLRGRAEEAARPDRHL